MVPAHLIELGQQALASVTTDVAGGAPLVRCQLLASEFYEALKRELRATSELGVVERAMVAAATGLCRHAATASITPDTMLAELRRAIDLLQANISPCDQPPAPPRATAHILCDRGRPFESGLAGLRLSPLWLLGFFSGTTLSWRRLPLV